jgi:hypothetical protein
MWKLHLFTEKICIFLLVDVQLHMDVLLYLYVHLFVQLCFLSPL